MARSGSDGSLDPITFEILRHRLWAINDEQGLIMATISGSPVVYEANDFNSALLTPEGDLLFSGLYVTFHAAALDFAVRNIIAKFSDDPGIHDGDMFITNDPWSGALHMNDILVLTPVFWEGQIVMWTGIVAHELDVGGPVPGGFAVGCRDTFGEPPRIPPLKLVERGQLRRDVEQVFLLNTRMPGPMALDIRARVGSQNITRERILDLVRSYGVDTVLAAQRQIKEHVRTTLQARLAELPDGTWFEQAYMDHDGNDNILYRLQLAMTKKKDRLVFDYSGSSKQVPGSINCAPSGLRGGLLSAVLPMLCYDLPWCPGGVWGAIEVVAEEGSIMNARPPAAVSMGPVGATWMCGTLASATIAKMYACSDKYKAEVQGCWYPGTNLTTLAGRDQYGYPMAAMLMDTNGGGGGARGTRDGIDASGSRSAISAAIPNIETNEQKMPILQVYRKHRQDACGPGRFRGGVGLEYMVVPHGSPGTIATVNAAQGVSLPGGPGIYGGLPPTVQRSLILRNTNIGQQFAAGRMPTDWQEVECAGKDILAAKDRSLLNSSDAYVVFLAGGGGYGDPLTRDPVLVERDVRNGLCSPVVARDVYGVLLGRDERVDQEGTRLRRQELHAWRLRESRPVAVPPNENEDPVAPAVRETGPGVGERRLMPVGEHMQVVERDGVLVVVCIHCSHAYGPPSRDPKLSGVMRAAPTTEVSPLNRYGLVDEVVINQYFCPGCGTMIAANVQCKEDPPYEETRLEL